MQKCKYCVKEGDPLRTVMKDYLVDTNWLKIWTLNNDAHSTLGTECLPGLDCDQDVDSQVAIDNPHLVLGTPSGSGKRILWTGDSPPAACTHACMRTAGACSGPLHVTRLSSPYPGRTHLPLAMRKSPEYAMLSGAGVVYSPPADTSLQDIACLWRTSRKSLSAVNPDLHGVAGDVVKAAQPVCIVACSSTSVDPECLEPKLAQ